MLRCMFDIQNILTTGSASVSTKLSINVQTVHAYDSDLLCCETV
jgi:hypothetical protein